MIIKLIYLSLTNLSNSKYPPLSSPRLPLSFLFVVMKHFKYYTKGILVRLEPITVYIKYRA